MPINLKIFWQLILFLSSNLPVSRILIKIFIFKYSGKIVDLLKGKYSGNSVVFRSQLDVSKSKSEVSKSKMDV